MNTNICSVLRDWGYDCDDCSCIRDVFARLQSICLSKNLFVDTCPNTADVDKYLQICETWKRGIILPRRNKNYLKIEDKFVSFLRTLWLYANTTVYVRGISRKLLNDVCGRGGEDTKEYVVDNVYNLDRLLRYALRHEVNSEVCFYLEELGLLVFPIGHCLALFQNRDNSSFIEKIANVSGLYLRAPSDF